MEPVLVISKLRLRAQVADPWAARRHCEQALAGVDPRKVLSGRSSLLCIRRLTDPLPRRLKLSGSDPRVPPEWETALDRRLETLAAGAHRPALGPVPESAEAVLFADRAEFLACLALDWLQAGLPQRWWWRALSRTQGLTDLVQESWSAQPTVVPTAVARLYMTGCAREFLGALPSQWVEAVATRVARTFDVVRPMEALRDAGRARRSRDQPLGSASDRVQIVDGSSPEKAGCDRPIGPPPWTPWVSGPASGSAEVEAVLITSVLLERAPAVLRSTRFVDAVMDWTKDAAGAPKGNCPTESMTSQRARPIRVPDTLEFTVPEFAADPSGLRSEAAPASLTVDHDPSHNRSVPEAVRVRPAGVKGDSECTLGKPVGPLSSLPIPALEQPDANEGEARPATPPYPLVSTPEIPCLGTSAVDPAPAVTLTGWGGVFYLINVALALELYGDFTQPRSPGLALPLWDFLALVGRRLVGDPLVADPLWRWLARLSGRDPSESPGLHFDPPGTPPPTADPRGQGGADAAESAHGEALNRWLDQLMPCLETRVRRALGEECGADWHSMVLRQSARIETTSERVDVHFSLEDHPVALRRAGLDRNPGWIPAAGRIVTFHYD